MSTLEKIVKLAKSLFPTGRAFKIPVDGYLETLMSSLAESEKRAYDDAVSILDSALPDNDNFTEEDAAQWERRLGLIVGSGTLEQRKQAIIRKMNHPGLVKARQHRLYIETQLQAAGFDVQVHENTYIPDLDPDWIIANAAVNIQWKGVCFGNGLFVAVADNGVGNGIMTSPDGINWTTQTTPADLEYLSVVWGEADSLFVAVANTASASRTIITSPDGVTWSLNSFTSGCRPRSVAYGGGRFVAVGDAEVAPPFDNGMSSANGTSWSDSSGMGAGVNYNSVAYGAGLFVAVGNNEIRTSPTGASWTSRTSPISRVWQSVCFGDNLFVAVASSGTGSRIITSPDGITWTIRTSPSDDTWQSVIYSNGIYVAVSLEGTVMVSKNGFVWVLDTAIVREWRSVCSNSQGLFVAVASSGGTTDKVMYLQIETDVLGLGLVNIPELVSRDAATLLNWKGICFGNGLFVSVASSGTGNRIMTSPDGITWTARTSPADIDYESVVWGEEDGLFVAVASTGSSDRIVITSSDGLSWSLNSHTTGFRAKSVAYGEGRFVAVGNFEVVPPFENGLNSSNGTTWNANSGMGLNNFNSVAYGSGRFVAVGDNIIYSSENGSSWTSRTSPISRIWQSICFGDNLFVSVASSGTGNRIMTSPDGITWTARTSPSDDTWQSVFYSNGMYVAVSLEGTVMVSRDGISWSLDYSIDRQLRSISANDGLFVAVGDHTDSIDSVVNLNLEQENLVVDNIDPDLDSEYYVNPDSNLRSIFYIGGDLNEGVSVDPADVDLERESEFRQLILKLKPQNTIAALSINYV